MWQTKLVNAKQCQTPSVLIRVVLAGLLAIGQAPGVWAQATKLDESQQDPVTSTFIFDGTVINDDISASAGILKSKIATAGTWAATDLPADGYASTYVNVSGDTMAGLLTLPANGLVVGTDQLIVTGGYVGIGTTVPGYKLDVVGDVGFSGTLQAGTVPWARLSGVPPFDDTVSGAELDGVFTTTGLLLRTGAATYSTITNNSANWDTAYTDRLKWDGEATGLVAATGRTSLGLGALATVNAVAGGSGGTITDGTITDADLAAGSITKSKLNELRPHAQATPDATVRVEAGIVAVHQNEKIEFAAANSLAFAAVTANSRIDVLTLEKTGALKITQGIQAASPTAPMYPLNELPIAEVTITETTTPVITDADIKDVRFFLDIEGTHEQVENTFTVGINSDATTTDLAVRFGQATGQESLTFTGAGTDLFQLSDSLNLLSGEKYKINGADLAFSDLAGTLGDAQIAAGAVDLDSTEVAGILPDANVIDTITASNYLPLAGGTMIGNIVIPDAGTLGQAAGPLLTFDDTNNELEITGGSVGIGTTGPGAYKLNVIGKIAATFDGQASTFFPSTTDTRVFSKWDGGGGANLYAGVEGGSGAGIFTGASLRMGVLGTDNANPLGFATNSTIHAVIDSSGNVGIGTTDPGDKLQVTGDIQVASGGAIKRNFSGNTGRTMLYDATGGITVVKATDNYSTSGVGIYDWNNNGLFVQQGGSVGIGTASPGAMLDVNGGVIVGGAFNIGELYFSPLQNISLPLGTETWINLMTIPNNHYVRIQLRSGSQNSEEIAEIKVFGTYYISSTAITVERQTYNDHLREVRVTGSDGGPKTVYIKMRSSDFAPSVNWRVLDSKGTVTINNVIAAPTGGTALIVSGNLITSTNTGLSVAGNVGIGTTGPAQKLEVNGNILVDGNLIQINNSGTPELYMNKLGIRGWSIRNDGAFKVFNWEDSSYPLTILNGGNVGIGTTGPAEKLEVVGNIKISGPLTNGIIFADGTTQATSSSTTVSGTPNYVSKFTSSNVIGNSQLYDTGTAVGIGTTGPGAKLDVYDNADGSCLRLDPGVSGADPKLSSCGYDLLIQGYEIGLQTGGTTPLHLNRFGNVQVGLVSETEAANRFYVNGQSAFMSGNVGIGTAGPGAKLDVRGAGGSPTVYADQAGGVGAGFNSPLLRLRSGDLGANDTVWDLYGSDGGGSPLPMFGISQTTGGTNEQWRFIIDNDGDIGLGGVTSPSARLELNTGSTSAIKATTGAAGGFAAELYNTDGGGNVYVKLAGSSGSNVAATFMNGNVGIGSTSPTSAKLVVSGDIRLDASDAEIEFNNGGARLYASAGNTLAFHTGGGFGSSALERMRIDSTGNVGIGVATPQTKLDVLGDIGTPFGGFGRYENLATNSEALNLWGDNGSSTVVTANNIAAPDGATTAEKFLDNTGSANDPQVRSDFGGLSPAGKTYTFSLWAKSSVAGSQLQLTLRNETDVVRGTSTVSLGTGWERYSVTGAYLTGDATVRVVNHLTNVSGTTEYHLWGAQLEQAASPGVYARTTTTTTPANRGLVVSGKASFQGDVDLGEVAANTIRLRGTVKGASPTLIVDQDTAADIADFRDTGVSVFKIADGGAITATGPLTVTGSAYLATTSGNVGIGTTNPNASWKLDVNGYIAANGEIDVGMQSGVANPRIYIGDSSAGGDYGILSWDSPANSLTIKNQNGGNQLVIASGGNVGIGTTGPNAALHVAGGSTGTILDGTGSNVLIVRTSGTDRLILNNGPTLALRNETGFEMLSASANARFRIAGGGNTLEWGDGAGTVDTNLFRAAANILRTDDRFDITNSNGILTDRIAQYNSTYLTIGNGTNDVYMNGNVGIGTTTVPAKLTVKATDGATGGIRLDNSSGFGPIVNIHQTSSDGYVDLYTGNNPTVLRTRIAAYGDSYFNASGGNVGIGTASPGALMDLNSGTAWSSGWLNNLRLTGLNYPALRFFSTASNKTSLIGNNNDGGLWFGVNGTGDAFGSYGMVIQPGGNVGIGTTSPESTLDVRGSVTLGPTSNNPEKGRWNPLWTAIASSKSLYDDEEFAAGANSVSVYNNSGGDGVVITRVADAGAPNSSGYVLQITDNGNATSPGYGGFVQTINSARNKTFVQRFRAKLDVGRTLNIAENSQGTNSTSYWLTPTAGTGKWEDYIRVSHCGNTGTFNDGGHVYVTGGSSTFTWYVASANVYEVEASPVTQYVKKAGDTMTGSLTSSVAPGTGGALRVKNNAIAIEQIDTEGNTRLFADFNPYHSWGIYHDNPDNILHFTRRDGVGFETWSEAGPGGTTTTTSVAQIDLDDGRAAFYGSVGIGTASPQTALHIADPGVIRLANGRQLEWGGSGSTMVYGYNAGDLRFATGSQDRLTLTSSGNVRVYGQGPHTIGYNTNAPLDIQIEPTVNDRRIRFINGSSLATGGWEFFASDAGYNTARLVIQNNGNVGIGTTSPDSSARLHLVGQPYLHLQNSGEATLKLTAGAVTNYIGHNGWGIGTGKIGIGDGSTPTVIFDNNNRWVGIGGAPSTPLQVATNGSYGALWVGSSVGPGWIYYGNSAFDWKVGKINSTSNAFEWRKHDDTVEMTLDTSGVLNAVGGFQWNGQSLDSRYLAIGGTAVNANACSGDGACEANQITLPDSADLYWSYPVNDPGIIDHVEVSNSAEFRLMPSDDNSGNDRVTVRSNNMSQTGGAEIFTDGRGVFAGSAAFGVGGSAIGTNYGPPNTLYVAGTGRVTGTFQVDSNLTVTGSSNAFNGNLTVGTNNPGGCYLTMADDGCFADPQNGWIQVRANGGFEVRNGANTSYQSFASGDITANGTLIVTGATTVGGDLTVTGTDINLVRGDSSQIHRVGKISFDYSTGTYDDSQYHGLASTTYSGGMGDSVSLNTFNDFTLRLDANNNDGTSYFRVTNDTNTTGNVLFQVEGPSGQVLTTAPTNISYAAGNYLIYGDDPEYSVVDDATDSNYKLMKTFRAAKSGTLRIKWQAYIQSGTYYWAYKIATNNGATTLATSYFGTCDDGSCGVHNYEQFTDDVSGVNAGDLVELWMVSSTGGGGPVAGNGQTLYAKEFRMYSASPSTEWVATNIWGADVGINTTAPSAKLDVKGTAPGGSIIRATVTDGQGSGSFGYGFYIDNTAHELAQILATYNDSGSGGTGYLTFNTRIAGSLAQRMKINTAGNVMIGAGDPSYKLDVQGGQINTSGGLCIAGDCKTNWSQVSTAGGWTDSGSDVVLSTLTDEVGIGTTAPASPLEIRSAPAAGASQLVVRSNSGTNVSYGGLGVFNNTGNGGYITSGDTSYSPTAYYAKAGWLTIAGTGTTGLRFGAATRSDDMVIDTNGNVGIGTASPQDKLQVNGNVLIQTTTNEYGYPLKVNMTVGDGVAFYGTAQNTHFGWGANENVYIRSGVTGGVVALQDGGGSVGIGTATPGAKLDVYNPDTASDLIGLNILNNDSSGAGFWLKQNTAISGNPAFILSNTNDSTRLLTVLNGGNVGIGVTNPGYKLNIQGSGNLLQVDNTALGLAPLTIVDGELYTAENRLYVHIPNGWVRIGGGTAQAGLSITPKNTGNPTLVLQQVSGQTGDILQWFSNAGSQLGAILSNGNVGIGSTSPMEKLDVAGPIKANNHLTHLSWTVQPGAPWVPGYVKLKTPIVYNEGNGFSIKILGYRYGIGGRPIEIRCGGYAYSTGLISTGCHTDGTNDPVGIGVDTDNTVMITIGSATNGNIWYWDHFTAEYSGDLPKSASGFTWSFQQAVDPTTTNTNNVYVDDSGGVVTASNGFVWGSQSLDSRYARADMGTTIAGSVTADLFIDRQGSGYYVDPATDGTTANRFNGGLRTCYSNTGGCGVTVSDDGGIYDRNDAYLNIETTNGLQIRTNGNGGWNTLKAGSMYGTIFYDQDDTGRYLELTPGLDGTNLMYQDSPSHYVFQQGSGWGVYWETSDSGTYQNSLEFRGGGTIRHALELGTGNAYFGIGAGSVGIGTTSPQSKLEIAGTGTSAELKLFDTDISGAAYGKTRFFQDGQTLTMQSVYANEGGTGSLASFAPGSITLAQPTSITGNLTLTGGAIFDTSGTSSNTRTLTIKNAGQAQINFGSYPASWTSALQIQNNNNTDFVWISPLDDGQNARFRASGSGLDFYVGGGNDTGTLAMSLDSGGSVGIGTSPSNKFDVNGNMGLLAGGQLYLYTGSTNVRGYLQAVEAGTNGGAGGASGLIIATSGGEHIGFKDGGLAGTENMTIRGDTGNVGIGTTSPGPNARLHAVTGNFADYAGYFQNTDSGGNVYVKLAGSSGSGVAATFMNGNVGIGTTTPQEKLDVAGAILYRAGRGDNLVQDPLFAQGSTHWGWWGDSITFVTSDLPDGTKVQAARASIDGNPAANDNSGFTMGPTIKIDPNKAYRISVWMKGESGGTGGTKYLGVNTFNSSGTEVGIINPSGTSVTNPYFHCAGLPGNDAWYRMTAYIYPANTPNGWVTPPDANGDGCNVAKTGRFDSTASTLLIRFYNYSYNAGAQTVLFALPTIEEMVREDKIKTIGNNLYIAQNVGIGTTIPSGKLDVRGSLYVMSNGSNSGEVKVGYTGSSPAGYYATYAP